MYTTQRERERDSMRQNIKMNEKTSTTIRVLIVQWIYEDQKKKKILIGQ